MVKRTLNWESGNPSSSLTLPLTHQVTSDELLNFADPVSLIHKTGTIIPASFTGS